MLPIRTRSVFKSRWMALLWSAGIIWSAVEFVDTQPAGPANGVAPANGAASSADAAQIDATKAAIDQIAAIK